MEHIVSAYVDVNHSSIILGTDYHSDFDTDPPESEIMISAPHSVLLLSSFDAHFSRVNLYWNTTPVAPEQLRDKATLPVVDTGTGSFSIESPEICLTTIDADVDDVVLTVPHRGTVSVSAVRTATDTAPEPVMIGGTPVAFPAKSLEEWHIVLSPAS